MENYIIDLNECKLLNEQSLTTMGFVLKKTLEAMFRNHELPGFKARGQKAEIDKFIAALAGEKKYMMSYIAHGLDDPRTTSTKYKLDNAVKAFERQTGIKWPFK